MGRLGLTVRCCMGTVSQGPVLDPLPLLRLVHEGEAGILRQRTVLSRSLSFRSALPAVDPLAQACRIVVAGQCAWHVGMVHAKTSGWVMHSPN